MEPSSPHSTRPTPRYTHSLRLTFTYKGGDARLARVERVAMLAPAVVTPPPERDQAGYWIEVRDSAGKLLYHRPLHDPMRATVEVFGEEPGDPIYRQPNKSPEGEFEVIVPDLPDAARFSFNGPPSSAKTPGTSSKELVQHDFAELRRLDVNRPRGGEQS